MKKIASILLGLLTLWPLIDIILFAASVFPLILSLKSPVVGNSFDASFNNLFAFRAFSAVISILLIAFYIIHAFRNSQIANNKKFLWAVAMFFGYPVVLPIYWYIYFWRNIPAPDKAENIYR